MSKSNILYLAIFCILIASCKTDNKEILGYKYIVHESTGDRKPATGDYVYFGLTITDEKDSVITAMTAQPQLPLVKIPEEEVEGRRKNPVEELLRISSLNDSMTIIMPIDSFDNTSMDLSQYKEIKYKIKVRKILNESEYQVETQRFQEEMRLKLEETKKLLPEITQKVEDFLAEYENGKVKMQKTASGLEYFIIDQGSGPKINSGSGAAVHYYGALMDGQPFDNSYRRGEPYRLTVGRGEVIKGWDEGLQLLNEGGSAFLVIPSSLAYGETGSGSIPPGATIMFHVGINEVNQ
jgi:FKBP-type peptidyl-prolyl cis-trans isomerase